MVRTASALILCSILAGCQTTQNRLSKAEVTKAVAQIKIDLPDMPDACIALMGRAYPKAGEKWVILQKRWEALADNRDQQSADCLEWWTDYRSGINP